MVVDHYRARRRRLPDAGGPPPSEREPAEDPFAARALGLSVSGMKSRVQRGLRQLRRLLTECCRVETGPSGSISGYEPGPGCEAAPAGGDSHGGGRVDPARPRGPRCADL